MIVRPTKNSSLYSQMVGRGLRLHPDKEKLILIDCCGVTGKASLCTAPSLLGMDLDAVPDSQKSLIEGDLFDLPPLITQYADCPQSWIQNVKIVDLWAKEQNYDTHNLNFFKMPNGDLVLSLPHRRRIVLPAQDELGNTVWNGVKLPMQSAIDGVYRFLQQSEPDTAYIWDLTKAKRWGRAPASDKQKAFIKRKKVAVDTDSLTKLEAMQILNRVMYKS